MFVHKTWGGGLVRRLKVIENSLNKVTKKKVKLIEKGGSTLESILVKVNPPGDQRCLEKLCQVCGFVGAKGHCQDKSVFYTDTCIKYEEEGIVSKYYGETSASCR